VSTSNTDAPFLPLSETRNTGGVSVTTPFDCDESAGSALRYPSASTDAPIDDSWSCRNLQSVSGSRLRPDRSGPVRPRVPLRPRSTLRPERPNPREQPNRPLPLQRQHDQRSISCATNAPMPR
jgi:hypothetical protein